MKSTFFSNFRPHQFQDLLVTNDVGKLLILLARETIEMIAQEYETCVQIELGVGVDGFGYQVLTVYVTDHPQEHRNTGHHLNKNKIKGMFKIYTHFAL